MFFKRVASDLTPITFPLITLGFRKWPAFHSHWSNICVETPQEGSRMQVHLPGA